MYVYIYIYQNPKEKKKEGEVYDEYDNERKWEENSKSGKVNVIGP